MFFQSTKYGDSSEMLNNTPAFIFMAAIIITCATIFGHYSVLLGQCCHTITGIVFLYK